MLVKSLAISVVAASLGPAIGVGVFLLVNGNRLHDELEFDRGEVTRTFAEPRLWPGPKSTGMPERREIDATELSPELAAWRTVVSCPDGQPGLPLGTIPVSKLESGRAQPASVLTEAERRADRMLAARSLLEPAVDSRARSGAGGHCNGAASSRSGPELPAAS